MAKQGRQLDTLAQMFRVLGDRTRLRILKTLQDGEINVSAICARLKSPQPTVSRHLGILRMAGLVRSRRSGKQIYYSVANGDLSRYAKAMDAFLSGAGAVRLGPMVMALTGK